MQKMVGQKPWLAYMLHVWLPALLPQYVKCVGKKVGPSVGFGVGSDDAAAFLASQLAGL